MPAGPVTIRFRHALRLARDVLGHWHHNRARWPVVAVVGVMVALLLLAL